MKILYLITYHLNKYALQKKNVFNISIPIFLFAEVKIEPGNLLIKVFNSSFPMRSILLKI